jgi:LuxR family transcriptional regulator, maltose regulon positive regulatory protein
MELIREKISTPTVHPAVARQRLLDQFAEHLPCYGATVITGRAGMGKTMLATACAEHYWRRIAWYKVDARDTDLRLFLRYFVASVARTCPKFGQRTWPHLLRIADLQDSSALAEALAYCLQQQDSPMLLVLDDLHLLYDTPWLAPFLHRLMSLLPEETHLLMAARSLPPAPLWRFRSKQQLRVINESALLFTLPETEELFAYHGLSIESGREAWRRTNGRAAALDGFVRQASRVTVAA